MKIIMPQLGETVAEGTITVWHKKVGEQVEAQELLFEVGTDKVETEIPAPVSGVLTKILVPEGETVDVGVTLAVIDDGSEATDDEPAAEKAPKAETAPAASRHERGTRPARGKTNKKLSPVVRKLLAENGLDAGDIEGTGTGGRITRRDVLTHLKAPKKKARDKDGMKLSPVVRRRLAEHRLDPADIQGTGAEGRIKRNDVLAYVSGSGKKRTGDQTIPFNLRRKLTAEHMVRSKATSAHVLQAVEADFMVVEQLRGTRKEAWKEKEGFSLTYLPFIARATCLAIEDFHNVNATIDEESLTVYGAVHLAIAVDLNFEGLVAPVIRDAGSKSLGDLARAIHDLAGRARDNKLSPDDLTGATYTISNSGSFGTMITAPIINQPQVAILSADGVSKKPVVIEGPDGDSIAIHPVGVLAQSFDHRAIDGAYSAAFLRRLREIIETHDWESELG